MYEASTEYTKNLQDYFQLFLRHIKLFVIPAALVLFGSVVFAYVLPPVFESTAIILIEQPEVPPDVIRSTVTSYADQRLQVIKQRVATTENLKRILDRYDLYPELRASEPLSKVAQRFRDDINMETISARVVDPRSGRPMSATIAFNLSYVSRNPRLALQIANELVTFYLAENIRERQGQAAETTKFLARESERLAALIGELETKLADFKKKNTGKLPEQASVNFGILERTERELVTLDRRIQALEHQQRFVRAELSTIEPNIDVTPDGEPVRTSEDRLQALRGEYSRLRAIYGPEHPDVIRAQREVAAMESRAVGDENNAASLAIQLRTARDELAQARELYSSKHPEMRRLEAVVDRLTSELDLARQQTSQQDESKPAANPQYVLLQVQLKSLGTERQSLLAEREALQDKIAEYEVRALAMPEIERAYLSLVRDYENKLVKYKETKDKQLAAELSQSLETERMSERFSLIEPPQLPVDPIRPKRMVIVGVGALLAIGIGAALVIALDLMDQGIYGSRQLTSVIGEGPLVTIPLIVTRASRIWEAVKNLLWVLGSVAFFVSALALVHVYLRPLDHLWFSLLRHLPL